MGTKCSWKPLKNQPQRRADTLGARARRLRDRQRVFDVLGAVCQRCGYSDVRALTFDHRDGALVSSARCVWAVATMSERQRRTCCRGVGLVTGKRP
jgi:hypothetical protein